MSSAESNKLAARDFLNLVIANRIDEAYRKHVGVGFVHHNPYFRSDADTLRRGMQESEDAHPNKVFEIQRAIAEGDLVAVHSRLVFAAAPTGMAVVHLFRFEGGKIVEFWDVGQILPDEMVNERGMF
ncbi:MAG TPA: nuclear transport factor 2 family protein [Fontimonas sp.]